MRTTLVLLLSAVLTSTAAGQEPHRSGLWGEVGLGWGALRTACGHCEEVASSQGGWSYFRLGGTVSPYVYVGAETAGFFDDSFVTNDSTTLVAEVEALSFVAMWFPGKSGFFLKGGMGVAQGRFTVLDDSTESTFRGTGMNINVAVGWDFRIAPKMSLTTNLSSTIVGIGDFVTTTRTYEDVIGTSYTLSVGVTFR